MNDRSDLMRDYKEEPPPFGSWKALYSLVLLALVIEIAIFYAFTVYYR